MMKRLLRAAGPLILALYPHERVAGKRVIFTDLKAPRDRCVASLREALHVLGERDPRNYRRVLRYSRHFVVWPGHYFATDHMGGIQLAASYLLEADPAQLAAVLVHEAVHLRIRRYGVTSHPTTVARVELRCVKEEANFLRRIPGDGEQWAREAEEELSNEWWTESARREHVDKVIHDVSAPGWLQLLLRRLR